MIEQWFLDLDGVRSGPYQTPEVVSLIAEGEVLPHHRISIGLKDQSWMTILDWRLEQAKTSAQAALRTKVIEEVIAVEPVEEPKAVPPPIKLVVPPQAPGVETIIPLSIAEPLLITELPINDDLVPVAVAPIPEIAAAPAPVRPKRDPAAEMFDMLQKSKQKRQTKTVQAPPEVAAVEPVVTRVRKTLGLTRSSLIGMVITVVGFFVGQLFQQTTPPTKEAGIVQTTPVTPPVSNPVASHPPSTEVIDRSNDKMTIRATVEKQNTGNTGKLPPKTVVARKAPEGVQSEKEVEELQNLRKELQELKALKTNGNLIDEDSTSDMVDAEIDPNAPPMPPNSNNNYNPYPPQNVNGYEQAR